MAGTQGQAGKPQAPKISPPRTSGKPAGGGAPSGAGSFKGTKTSPTNVKARPPR